jgi:signal transduction histidine kinase
MTPFAPDPSAPTTADDKADWLVVRQLSHDLNNLLSAIGGYADMLIEDQPEDGEVAVDLRRIRDAAERATEIVGELQALSQRARGE